MFAFEVRGVMAQSNKYLTEENCDGDNPESVCSRSYSTDALDAIKLNGIEPISDLNDVSVHKHIKQIEEANAAYNRPLPYQNEAEKQQYIKTAYYQKLLKQFEDWEQQSTSSNQHQREKAIIVDGELRQSELKGNELLEERVMLVNVFYSSASAESILKDLSDSEYALFDDIDGTDDKWLVLSITQIALDKLYSNLDTIEIISVKFATL